MTMLPWDKALEGLNSPLDWAIVIGAGTLGFSLDALINIVPAPVFSPGVCGVMAMTSALTIKKSFDAAQESKRRRALAQLSIERAEAFIRDAEAGRDLATADHLSYLLRRAKIDHGALLVLEAAVEKLPPRKRRSS